VRWGLLGLVATLLVTGLLTHRQSAAANGQGPLPVRQALASLPLLRLDPNGFEGNICVDGSGCARGVAKHQVVPGSYTLRSSSSTDESGGGTAFGMVTVAGDGTLSPDPSLARNFTVAGATLVARVSPVTVDFAGFEGGCTGTTSAACAALER
jgi:hypothetical protein